MEQDIITLQDVFLFEKTGITEGGKVRGITPPTQMFQTVVEIN